jgi:hypothetical protein
MIAISIKIIPAKCLQTISRDGSLTILQKNINTIAKEPFIMSVLANIHYENAYSVPCQTGLTKI